MKDKLTITFYIACICVCFYIMSWALNNGKEFNFSSLKNKNSKATKIIDNNTSNNNYVNTMICNLKQKNEDNYTTDTEVTIKYKNDVILSVTNIAKIETDVSHIDTTINLLKGFSDSFNEIDGIDYRVTKDNDKIVQTMKIDYEKLDILKIKDLLNESTDSINFSNYVKNKRPSFSEYKEELKNYSCK